MAATRPALFRFRLGADDDLASAENVLEYLLDLVGRSMSLADRKSL